MTPKTKEDIRKMKHAQEQNLREVEYFELCDRVEEIDPEASRFLRELAPRMTKEQHDNAFSYCNSLTGCFAWSKTPQGHEYWMNINRKLEGDR